MQSLHPCRMLHWVADMEVQREVLMLELQVRIPTNVYALREIGSLAYEFPQIYVP
jgi:hypothetical protein